MRTNGVVPEEPIDHLQIEGRYIVSQESSIEHDEVFGDRPVEPLDESVFLWRTHMGIEVSDPEEGAGLLEVLGKLAPIVSLKFFDRKRTDLNDSAEEVSGTLRRVARVCSSKSELLFNIDGGEDVSFGAVDETNDGIELHALLVDSPELCTAYLSHLVMPSGRSEEGEFLP